MPDPLVILAAGSLRAALSDYADRWDKQATLAFGPAGLLRQEIERGRACDIYLSANVAYSQALARAADVPWRAFAANPIRIVTRPGARIRSEGLLAYLLDPGTRIGTSTPGADPSGDYAQVLFDRCDLVQPGAGAILRAKAMAVVGASIPAPDAAPKDRGIAQLLTDEAIDAFVGYRTSAMAMGDAVETVRPPEAMAVVARYALVVLRPSEEADRFADGLSGRRGRAVLSPYGFDAP
ncbi:MAG: substrate-binding domain-containing protein [Janthinobacterium lividum]